MTVGSWFTAQAHRAPYGDRPRVEIHVVLAQRTGLFGADAGEQAEHHVGAGPGVLASLEQGRGLLGGQRSAGPAILALGVSTSAAALCRTCRLASAWRIARVSACARR